MGSLECKMKEEPLCALLLRFEITSQGEALAKLKKIEYAGFI